LLPTGPAASTFGLAAAAGAAAPAAEARFVRRRPTDHTMRTWYAISLLLLLGCGGPSGTQLVAPAGAEAAVRVSAREALIVFPLQDSSETSWPELTRPNTYWGPGWYFVAVSKGGSEIAAGAHYLEIPESGRPASSSLEDAVKPAGSTPVDWTRT